MWEEQERPIRAIISDIVSQHYGVYGVEGSGTDWAALDDAVRSLGELVAEDGLDGPVDMMTMATVDALREVLHDEIAQVHTSVKFT